MAAQKGEGRLTRIADKQITIIFQGPWNDRVGENVARARDCFPGAPIVVGSSDARMHAAFPGANDVTVVVVPDPGPLHAYMRSKLAPLNNVNRQIVSSRAGLAVAATPYAVKIRTDCTLDSRAFVEVYERAVACNSGEAPLLASSIYTLHPDGIEGFPFHVSDWFFFGPSEALRRYYDVPLMTEEDALWYDRFPHGRSSHYFARQYRSRFSPEQYIAVQNARKDGYVAPCFLDDVRAEVVASYRSYLASRFIVCDVSKLGLVFEKYGRVSRSHYQFFNCVWGSDWIAMVKASRNRALCGIDLGPVGPTWSHRRSAVRVIRSIDPILGAIKKCGLMPLIGDALGFFRRFDFREKNIC
ncbi:hypothetical protein WJ39_01755 [Burkholderia diffusa]|nr:hypothetical protein WJ39_01755 [Burkholderia diffusa]